MELPADLVAQLGDVARGGDLDLHVRALQLLGPERLEREELAADLLEDRVSACDSRSGAGWSAHAATTFSLTRSERSALSLGSRYSRYAAVIGVRSAMAPTCAPVAAHRLRAHHGVAGAVGELHLDHARQRLAGEQVGERGARFGAERRGPALGVPAGEDDALVVRRQDDAVL